MKIKLNNNNIRTVKSLLSLCPSVFSFVPLKFFKDELGNCFTTIETISINGDLVFSGIATLDEDLSELENNTGLVVRLPMTKAVISNIFGSDFSNIEISKAKIIAKDINKKIELALYKMENDEVMTFPFNSDDLFKLVMKMNKIENCPFINVNMTDDDIKDIIGGFSMINDATSIEIKHKNKNLNFKVEDFSGNIFNYNISSDKDEEFEGKFDDNFIKLINTVNRNNAEFESEMLYSSLIFSTTLKNESITATLATTALKD